FHSFHRTLFPQVRRSTRRPALVPSWFHTPGTSWNHRLSLVPRWFHSHLFPQVMRSIAVPLGRILPTCSTVWETMSAGIRRGAHRPPRRAPQTQPTPPAYGRGCSPFKHCPHTRRTVPAGIPNSFATAAFLTLSTSTPPSTSFQ